MALPHGMKTPNKGEIFLEGVIVLLFVTLAFLAGVKILKGGLSVWSSFVQLWDTFPFP
jgi:hypothetical protein